MLSADEFAAFVVKGKCCDETLEPPQPPLPCDFAIDLAGKLDPSGLQLADQLCWRVVNFGLHTCSSGGLDVFFPVVGKENFVWPARYELIRHSNCRIVYFCVWLHALFFIAENALLKES